MMPEIPKSARELLARQTAPEVHPSPDLLNAYAEQTLGGAEKDQKIYFAGGSANLYDAKGIGFDGKPAEPSLTTFAFDLRGNKWETMSETTPDASMDSGLVVTSDKLMIIGGMQKNQQVTARVAELPKAKGK